MSPYRLTKIEAPTRLILAFKEAFNQHSIPDILALLTDDCVLEHFEPAPEGTIYHGKENLRHFWSTFFEETSDIQLKIEELVHAGQRGLLWWRFEWMGSQTTPQTLRGVTIFLIKNEAISAMMSYIKGHW